MKFYIASKLENAETVKRLAAVLKASGHIHTYDWTAHGSVKAEGVERLREVGEKELRGVLNADVVIVIMPGGRGTHVEMGIALGTGKRVVICAEDDKYFRFDDNTTSFYWCKNVVRFTGGADKWPIEILRLYSDGGAV